MRRDARVLAFSLAFERLFNSSPCDDEMWEQIKDKDRAFAEEIFSAYSLHREDIEKKIEGILVGYSLDRVHKIDLALLSIAIAEIDYIKTPAPVVINEVVEMAKVYSSEDSPKFLNGVLSSAIKKGSENA